MIRGTRSRYCAGMRFTHRSGGSFAWLSVETMKYFFGSSTRAVRCQPPWPGVSSRQRLGALISTAWLMGFSLGVFIPAGSLALSWVAALASGRIIRGNADHGIGNNVLRVGGK